ncbi:MAG: hypothetical protein LBC62_03645 [Treponema sp.]|nr:hypothetical protein [Treponema sp.]
MGDKDNGAGKNRLPPGRPPAAQEAPPAAERRETDKQRQTLIRRLERQEGEILKTLEALEGEKLSLERELSRPEVYSSGERARAVKLKLDGITAAIEGETKKWEETAAQLAGARIQDPPC